MVTGLKRLVMKGRVGVHGGGGQAVGPAEEVVVLIDVIVYNLTFSAQGLHRPLRGRRLEQCSVMVNVIKGDKSCFQRARLPFSHGSVCYQGRSGTPSEGLGASRSSSAIHSSTCTT